MQTFLTLSLSLAMHLGRRAQHLCNDAILLSLVHATFFGTVLLPILQQRQDSRHKVLIFCIHPLLGNLKDVAGWQKLLEQLVAQMVPPLAAHKPTPAGPPQSLSSPEHTSSVDMVISPPPVMRLSPQRKQSPARSRGSPAGSSPRMLSMGSRGQKRSASTLRPR